MRINKLLDSAQIENKKSLKKKCSQFNELIKELNDRGLSEDVCKQINTAVNEINTFSGTDGQLRRLISRKFLKVLQLLEKEEKLVPKNFYRNRWIAIGMAGLGVPFGVAFGTSLGNMAFIGIGIPIGLAIGVAIGTNMDQKARDAGRQLDLNVG